MMARWKKMIGENDTKVDVINSAKLHPIKNVRPAMLSRQRASMAMQSFNMFDVMYTINGMPARILSW
jgi:hypothetical protein